MNELTFDELRQIDGGSYEEGRELGHKIGKAFYGACAMYILKHVNTESFLYKLIDINLKITIR